MVISVASLILIDNYEDEEDEWCGGSKHFIGKMHSYEIYHKTPHTGYEMVRTSERYDDKFFEYLEGMQESRDKTFMKGKVFLKE